MRAHHSRIYNSKIHDPWLVRRSFSKNSHHVFCWSEWADCDMWWTLFDLLRFEFWWPKFGWQKIIGHTSASLKHTHTNFSLSFIQVTTEDDEGNKMSCSIVSLRVRFVECMHLELGFTNPVKFMLREGMIIFLTSPRLIMFFNFSMVIKKFYSEKKLKYRKIKSIGLTSFHIYFLSRQCCPK